MNTRIIKAKLAKKNMTIIKLAKITKINPQTISNWINNKNTNQIKKFIEVCKLLDIDIKDL